MTLGQFAIDDKGMKTYAKFLLPLISVFSISFLTACQTTRENPNLKDLISESDYYNQVEQYTGSDKVYDGFYQVLDISVTLLNTQVSRGQLDQTARLYQWSQQDYLNKKSENETSLSKQTQVFMSFFVPERKHDNLTKQSSVWKIFLDAGGKRYEGRVEKVKMIFSEIKVLYPHHSRFNSTYKVVFPVPVSMVESAESSFTLTGPVGSVKINFPAAK